jgi:hypothetical protein
MVAIIRNQLTGKVLCVGDAPIDAFLVELSKFCNERGLGVSSDHALIVPLRGPVAYEADADGMLIPESTA